MVGQRRELSGNINWETGRTWGSIYSRMRGVTSALASLLALLMVSTSTSGSACDLSCWLGGAHSDCHTAASDPSAQAMTTMDMPGMNMDSHGNDAASLPQRHLRAKFHHATLAEMDLAIEPYQNTALFAVRTATESKHSGSLNSCTHGVCVQISRAPSPPRSDHARPRLLGGIAIRPTTLCAASNWIGPGASPPRISCSDDRLAILRI